MATRRAEEKRILTAAEHAAVEATHYPGLATLDRAALIDLARQLRDYHGKARDLARDRRRARRGKAEPRGAGAPPAEEGLLVKKQVFAGALKRVNARIETLDDAARREAIQAAMRDALARRQAAPVHHPGPGRTPRRGMVAVPSSRRTVRMDPREVGRVSQANKVAQAQRDG